MPASDAPLLDTRDMFGIHQALNNGLTTAIDVTPEIPERMSRPAWILGDGPEQLSYAATSSFGA
jgi:hypothetical protein